MPLTAALTYSDGITGTNSHSEIGGLDVSEASEVYEYEHKVYSPIDLNTGAIQGSRVHGPLKVTKPVDNATAPLYQALCHAQILEEVVLHFFRASLAGDGTVEEYWTITMTNVKVASIYPKLPNVKDEELLNIPLMEDVEFLYETIAWKHEPAALEFEDVWASPGG